MLEPRPDSYQTKLKPQLVLSNRISEGLAGNSEIRFSLKTELDRGSARTWRPILSAL